MCRISALNPLRRRVLLIVYAMGGFVNSEDTMRMPLRRHSRSRLPPSSRIYYELKSNHWISREDILKSTNWLSRAHTLKVNMSSTHLVLRPPTVDARDSERLELVLPPMDLELVSQRLYDVADVFYTVNVAIGTPPKNATMILDTGSSDMWVKQTAYHYVDSSTAAYDLAEKIVIVYGHGTLQGVQVQDRVCLDAWCATNQSFILATSIAGIANGLDFDGLIGLGGPGLFREPRGTPILNKLLGHDHPHRAFALYLSSPSLDSFVYFGSVSALESEARKLGLVQKNSIRVYETNGVSSYWLVSALISVDDKVGTGLKIDPQPIYCVLDSGTTLLAVPTYDLNSVLLAILGDDDKVRGRCAMDGATPICECSVEVNSLNFTFPTLDDNSLDIVLTKDNLFTPRGVNRKGDLICQVNIMSGGAMDFWIFGDVFLRKVYSIHDLDRSRVILFPRESSQPKSEPMLSMPKVLVVLTLFFASACMMIKGLFVCRRKMRTSFHAQSDLRDGLL